MHSSGYEIDNVVKRRLSGRQSATKNDLFLVKNSDKWRLIITVGMAKQQLVTKIIKFSV